MCWTDAPVASNVPSPSKSQLSVSASPSGSVDVEVKVTGVPTWRSPPLTVNDGTGAAASAGAAPIRGVHTAAATRTTNGRTTGKRMEVRI